LDAIATAVSRLTVSACYGRATASRHTPGNIWARWNFPESGEDDSRLVPKTLLKRFLNDRALIKVQMPVKESPSKDYIGLGMKAQPLAVQLDYVGLALLTAERQGLSAAIQCRSSLTRSSAGGDDTASSTRRSERRPWPASTRNSRRVRSGVESEIKALWDQNPRSIRRVLPVSLRAEILSVVSRRAKPLPKRMIRKTQALSTHPNPGHQPKRLQ